MCTQCSVKGNELATVSVKQKYQTLAGCNFLNLKNLLQMLTLNEVSFVFWAVVWTKEANGGCHFELWEIGMGIFSVF